MELGWFYGQPRRVAFGPGRFSLDLMLKRKYRGASDDFAGTTSN
jgi:hypothetical protein